MATEAAERKDEKIIAALLSCPTVRAASGACGVSETQIYTRLRTTEFKERYDAARRELLTQAAAYIQGQVSASIATMKEIRDNPAVADQVRLNAAESIVRNSLKLTEQADILTQLAELKKAVFYES